MAEHGGARKGSGRKPKADEIKRIELMDSIADTEDVWTELWQLCKSKNVAALKTWIEYRYGKPKERIDVTSNDKTLGNEWNLSKLNKKQLDALIELHEGDDSSSHD